MASIGGSSEPALRRAARNQGWLGTGNATEEVPGILERLNLLRKEQGKEGEPFETIIAVTDPPSIDVFRRLEDFGVSATVSYPLLYTLGPGTSLEEKRAALERYGNEFIAKL